MSDQPKPTTESMIGEQGQEIGAVASQQPTTGEWTAATVRNIAGRQLRATGDDLVAAAINAALAKVKEGK